MKKILRSSILVALMTPAASMAGPVAFVTSGADVGPNTLREALANGATKILIKPKVSEITVTSGPLIYDGTAPLTILGKGQVVDGGGLPDDDDIFQVTHGADLSISNLSFVGAGGYDIKNQGGGKGIYVDIPKIREGMVSVKLSKVTVSDTGDHGIHISDCVVEGAENDECGGGQGGDGEGSVASVFMRLNNVTVDGAGFGKQDADGVRVDERGDGDIFLVVRNSTFSEVGGDGIELDEGDDGSVQVNVRNALFESNGAYCSDEFVDDPISIDQNCDDEGDPDVDDAFDIDEAGAGAIAGTIVNVDLIDNYDEGLDFDSEGDGVDDMIDLDLINIFGSGNADEAIKVSEEDNASVIVRMRAIEIEGDVEVEEENDGDLRVTLNGSLIGDDLKLSQENPGTGTVKLRGTTVGDELDFNNVDEI